MSNYYGMCPRCKLEIIDTYIVDGGLYYHATCLPVRTTTDGQPIHAIANIDRLTAQLQAMTAERDKWKRDYFTVADAVASESTSAEHLAEIAADTRHQRDDAMAVARGRGQELTETRARLDSAIADNVKLQQVTLGMEERWNEAERERDEAVYVAALCYRIAQRCGASIRSQLLKRVGPWKRRQQTVIDVWRDQKRKTRADKQAQWKELEAQRDDARKACQGQAAEIARLHAEYVPKSEQDAKEIVSGAPAVEIERLTKALRDARERCLSALSLDHYVDCDNALVVMLREIDAALAPAPPAADNIHIDQENRFPWEDEHGGAPFSPCDDCRGCGGELLPENRRIADGCPCNSSRGVNHGLVPKNTCTCIKCDPEQTGSSRVPVDYEISVGDMLSSALAVPAETPAPLCRWCGQSKQNHVDRIGAARDCTYETPTVGHPPHGNFSSAGVIALTRNTSTPEAPAPMPPCSNCGSPDDRQAFMADYLGVLRERDRLRADLAGANKCIADLNDGCVELEAKFAAEKKRADDAERERDENLLKSGDITCMETDRPGCGTCTMCQGGMLAEANEEIAQLKIHLHREFVRSQAHQNAYAAEQTAHAASKNKLGLAVAALVDVREYLIKYGATIGTCVQAVQRIDAVDDIRAILGAK